MNHQEIKKKILSLLADRFEEFGPHDGIDSKEIAQIINVDSEKTMTVIEAMLALDTVDMNMGFGNVHLTPAGYSQARQNDQTIPRSGVTNVTFGHVSQSAVAFQNSSANVTVNATNFLQSLSTEIQNHPAIPPDEKHGLLQGIQDLIQHPVVAGIISTLLAGSILGAGK